MKKVLITGGAGFIGSHLCDALIDRGYGVRVLDNLSEQVHGKGKIKPSYLNHQVDLIIGDVRDKNVVTRALKDVDIVYHLAARVGVGQSMYEIGSYTDVNNFGTATLLDAIVDNPVEKLVVASSMSIYGEGFYKDKRGRLINGFQRDNEQLKKHEWELMDESGEILEPLAVTEGKRPDLSSIYALSKYDQERMCLIAGNAYDIPTIALRFFNVYGPRQALSNPYTGVLAIFASRYLNNKSPLIYEDGHQKRDFVNVHDVARACVLAGENQEVQGEAFNIGSGEMVTINQIAYMLREVMHKEDVEPEVTGKYRLGDIRHCFANIDKARELLGFEPQVRMDEGMQELAAWLENELAEDNFDNANKELTSRGLTV